MNFAMGLGHFFLSFLLYLLFIYMWVIIIRALVSWVNPDPYNPIIQILVRITEPVLRPLRRLVPPRKLGGLDISPILAILLIQLIRYILIYSFIGNPRY